MHHLYNLLHGSVVLSWKQITVLTFGKISWRAKNSVQKLVNTVVETIYLYEEVRKLSYLFFLVSFPFNHKILSLLQCNGMQWYWFWVMSIVMDFFPCNSSVLTYHLLATISVSLHGSGVNILLSHHYCLLKLTTTLKDAVRNHLLIYYRHFAIRISIEIESHSNLSNQQATK